jgi:hypothetical protein
MKSLKISPIFRSEKFNLCVYEAIIFQRYALNIADPISSIKLFNDAPPATQDIYRRIRWKGKNLERGGRDIFECRPTILALP